MITRKIVQEFCDTFHPSKTNAERNRVALPLLDAYPELARVCFHDYGVGDWEGYALPSITYFDDFELVEKLVALGADINPKDGQPFTLLKDLLFSFTQDFETRFKIIEFLLEAGADPNVPLDEDGTTALYHAVAHEQGNRLVPLFLRFGADPNRRSDYGQVPLHNLRRSVGAGDMDALRAVLDHLITHGADINAKDSRGNTPLIRSIMEGCLAGKEMLAYGADVHAKTRKGWTAIHAAAMAIDAEQAEDIVVLLKAGASCQVKDNQGYTPLHVAASLCGMEAARLLLEAGAEVNAKSNRGATPLDLVEAQQCPFEDVWPEQEAYVEMAALLRAHGATFTPGLLKEQHGEPLPVEKKPSRWKEKAAGEWELIEQEWKESQRWTYAWKGSSLLNRLLDLLKAAANDKRQDFQEIEALLRPDPELSKARPQLIEARIYNVGTPLHYAAQALHPGLVKVCLACGADVNIRNNEGKTPLMSALGAIQESDQRLEVIQLLLNAGADPNRGSGAQMPLSMLGDRGCAPLLQALLNAGADPNWQEGIALPPMHVLCEYPATLPLLVEHGGDINLATANGDTPLMLFMSAERAPALRTLLTLGAKVDHRNRQGICALHLAAMVVPAGDPLVKILLEGGADPNLRNRQGYTPLHFAAGSCALESIRLLLAAGADIHAASKKGTTPLAIVETQTRLIEFTEPPSNEEYAATAALLREAGAQQ